ncbi:MAG: hypothetical protein U9P12_04745, partial [Verrucomicrobiota bacterium]|nr:hypothetical protein [Verrucomicrobiota bacterium]
SITFYRSQQAGGAPRRILVSGGLGNLGEAESRLGIPVEAFDPLQGIRQGVVVADSGNLAVLAGMAMRGALELNLEPEALEKERRFRLKQPLWVVCAATTVVIAALWIWGFNRMAALARGENSEVRARIQALEKAESRLIPLENRIGELEGRSEAYLEAIRRRTFWLEVLIDVRGCLPDGMFLLESEPLRNNDELSGMRITVVSYLDKEADGVDAIINLRDSLRGSERFTDETRVFKRPTKRLFARQFVLDLHFAEGSE